MEKMSIVLSLTLEGSRGVTADERNKMQFRADDAAFSSPLKLPAGYNFLVLVSTKSFANVPG